MNERREVEPAGLGCLFWAALVWVLIVICQHTGRIASALEKMVPK